MRSVTASVDPLAQILLDFLGVSGGRAVRRKYTDLWGSPDGILACAENLARPRSANDVDHRIIWGP